MTRQPSTAARLSGPRILLVEDDATIAYLLRAGFNEEGFPVTLAGDGRSGLRVATEESFDLIVLDLNLPDLDGVELCRRLRDAGSEVPVIMLTARQEVHERIAGLDTGADDYLTKPFSFDELLARMRAVLRRRGHPQTPVVLESGVLKLNTETREVFRNDMPIQLTRKEFALLEAFLRQPRRVFTREALLTRIWGGDFASEPSVVDVHISHLRDKLGGGARSLIKTVYGVGYCYRPDEGSLG